MGKKGLGGCIARRLILGRLHRKTVVPRGFVLTYPPFCSDTNSLVSNYQKEAFSAA